MNIICNSTEDQTMYICCSKHMYKCPSGWIRKFLTLVLKTNTYKHLTVTLLHTHMNICSGIPAIDGSTSGSSLFVCLWDLLSLSAFFFRHKLTPSESNLETPKEQKSHQLDMDNAVAGWWLEFGQKLLYNCLCYVTADTTTSHWLQPNAVTFPS